VRLKYFFFVVIFFIEVLLCCFFWKCILQQLVEGFGTKNAIQFSRFYLKVVLCILRVAFSSYSACLDCLFKVDSCSDEAVEGLS